MSIEWTVCTKESVITLPEHEALERAVEAAMHGSGCVCASPGEEYILHTYSLEDAGDVVVQFHGGRTRLDSYEGARLSLGKEGVVLFTARSRVRYATILQEGSKVDLDSLYPGMLAGRVAEIGPAFSEFIVRLAEDKAALRERGECAPPPIVIEPLDYRRAGSILGKLSGLAPGAQLYSPKENVPLAEVVRRIGVLADPELVDWRKTTWNPATPYTAMDLHGSLDYLLDIYAAGYHLCWHDDLNIEYVRSSMYGLLRPGGMLLQYVCDFPQ